MPTTATHVLVAIVLAEIFRETFLKNNQHFPRYYILIAAVAGMIPDLDFLLFLGLFKFGFALDQIHRTFLHTIFIPLILLLIGIIILKIKLKNPEVSKRHMALPAIFFIFAAGSLLHLILDATLQGTITPLFPLSTFSLGLDLVSKFPEQIRGLIIPLIEAILLFGWLTWMVLKLKVRDYF